MVFKSIRKIFGFLRVSNSDVERRYGFRRKVGKTQRRATKKPVGISDIRLSFGMGISAFQFSAFTSLSIYRRSVAQQSDATDRGKKGHSTRNRGASCP